MEYKYFTLGREPKVGENIVVNGRRANVRFVDDKRKRIGRYLISKQPELAIDGVVFKILCHSPKLCKKQGMTPCKTLTLTKP